MPLLELRYNKNRDKKTGRYTSGSGGNLTKSSKNVRLDMNGVPFKYPNVYMSPGAYRTFRNKVGERYDTWYKGKEFCSIKYVDKEIYFENRGYGDYNIYRLKKGK